MDIRKQSRKQQSNRSKLHEQEIVNEEKELIVQVFMLCEGRPSAEPCRGGPLNSHSIGL